ncbi:MAG: 2-oxoacid:ferredoxin oxidoreductase subunit beta [Candidatus Melainabacteria bacterium RIFCSPLOWO2_02_FULL_35_15]|nr:MAG: 2-oxoacid:ferredoxin oxidoreductase subunit beta [Candidatus Melainabacteria bacterium RIFCSPLOWO2_12_FULL_35_11]OGI13276.1 MAG: 2-oxoacid:ferredoxin oxidoreductase subunit beta [Candidatus Melainabacteria bacterium RIFCSPLOWO2_02_FULL_35_15]
MAISNQSQYTKADFESANDIRWCPGCGDYAILSAVQGVVPALGIPKEKFVFISGIGCSSRFPHYMSCYGFHTIHGRALTVATGVKSINPDLSVWVITGDGDGLSIGGNHLIHAIRRNQDFKILLFNNRIYGLTKGQYSPTSELGKKTKSTPYGSIDNPINPASVAIASGATFVARTVDKNVKHMMEVLKKAAAHKGTAFIEIYQNCLVFNDNAFEGFTKKDVKDDHSVYIEHGKPLIFGKNHDKAIKLNGFHPEVINAANGNIKETLVHNEHADDRGLAYVLGQMGVENEGLPVAFGVLRQIEQPTYQERLFEQEKLAKEKSLSGGLPQQTLEQILNAGDTWMVK